MKLNVFLIHTAHQLHQVTKAVVDFKLTRQSVIIIYVDFNIEKEIIQSYLKESDYKIFYLSNWVFKDIIFNSYKWKKYISQLKDLKKNSHRINFFTSQYFNDTVLLANKILKPFKFYLMDEGTANFLYSQIREKNKVFSLGSLISL